MARSEDHATPRERRVPNGAGLTKHNGIVYNTTMKPPRIVIDTNVLVSALRSRRGASHRLLMRLASGDYVPVVSVPLVLEYESAAKRRLGQTRLTPRDIEAVIDYLCAEAVTAKIHYLWRPLLKDAKDDMVLEAAVASGAGYIVTFNTTDFTGAERFGVKVLTPQADLQSTPRKFGGRGSRRAGIKSQSPARREARPPDGA